MGLPRNQTFDPVEIVRSIYDAYDGGDARTPAQYFSEDVEGYISDFVPWGGHRKGMAEVRDGLNLLRQYVSTTFEVSEIIDAGDHVVAIGDTAVMVHQTGRSFSVPTVHVWKFAAGKVVRFENYLDRSIVSLLELAA